MRLRGLAHLPSRVRSLFLVYAGLEGRRCPRSQARWKPMDCARLQRPYTFWFQNPSRGAASSARGLGMACANISVSVILLPIVLLHVQRRAVGTHELPELPPRRSSPSYACRPRDVHNVVLYVGDEPICDFLSSRLPIKVHRIRRDARRGSWRVPRRFGELILG